MQNIAICVLLRHHLCHSVCKPATFTSSYKMSALWLAAQNWQYIWRHSAAAGADSSCMCQDCAVPEISCCRHHTADVIRKGNIQPKANGYCCSCYRVFVDKSHRYVPTRLYGVTLHSHSRLNLKSRTLYCLLQTISNSLATQTRTHTVPSTSRLHQATVRHAGPSVP